MEYSLAIRLVGLVIIFAGVVVVVNPELIINRPIPSDTHQAIERRIWWGLIIGFGILLQFHQQLLPLKPTLIATGAALFVGLLVARFIGIAIDGSIPKQWFYVLIELLVLAPLVWWYLKLKSP